MNRITVALDFGPATDAVIDCAANLATTLHCDLHLIHVYRMPMANDILAAGSAGEEEGLAALQSIALDVRGRTPQSVFTEYSVVCGPVKTSIVDACRRSDLLLMGQTFAKGVWRFLLGDTTGSLIEESPCPILVVPAKQPYTPPERFGLAIDEQSIPPGNVALLRELMTAYDARLDVFHHRDDAAPSDSVEFPLYDLPYSFHYDRKRGSLTSYLLDASQRHTATWLVLTHRRQPQWRQWVTRSQSERVAALATVPVLVMMEPDPMLPPADAAATPRATTGAAASGKTPSAKAPSVATNS